MSHSTVSLILNERGQELRIHPETEARVRQIARELNYVPNQLARGLRGLKTQAIGVLWSLCGPHPTQGIARAITLQAQKHQYTAHLADSLSDVDIISHMLADLARRRIDGVVVQLDTPFLQTSAVLQQLAAFSAAVVVASIRLKGGTFDQVVHNQEPAFEAMVDALIEAGRRRFVFLGDHPGKIAHLQRFLARHSEVAPLQAIPFKPLTTTRPETFKILLDELAPAMTGVDTVICNNDDMAAGLMQHLKERGICVPDEVAVIGFNDNPFAPFLSPPLASVIRHDLVVAERAVELLFERLGQPDREPRVIDIPMTFVARASSGLPLPTSSHSS